jgi:hypothetical protein
MLSIRQSGAETPNRYLESTMPAPAAAKAPPRRPLWLADNSAWRKRVNDQTGLGQPGDVLLLGGGSLVDFRIRVAQSHARDDLTPSYWSLIGVLIEGDRLLTVPLLPSGDASAVPVSNGIVALPLSAFDDVRQWPNIAVLRFPRPTQPVASVVDRIRSQRTIADLPALIVAWLGFVWGAGDSPNPLLGGRGLPSAVFVETAFGMVDVELTPGLGSASSCPEAVWQSGKWWHEFYAQTVAGAAVDATPTAETTPSGRYAIRQRSATYIEPVVPAL